VKSINETALDAFLGLIAEKGFAAVALRDVAEAAGVGMADLYRVYPDKVSLVAAFMARLDTEVLAGTPTRNDPEETARDRLFDVMMRRYDALRPHRAALGAIRRAGTRDPMLALAMGPALRRSMAAMLVRCGRTVFWRFTMPFPASSTATRRPICPRQWPLWTAVSKWRKDGRNSLINIRNRPNRRTPRRARIRLLREVFVQCTMIALDLLRCERR
jgi:AcrR family transcriptional regulator